MKEQINFRASKITRQQLDWLTAKWGVNQSEALTLIIDRMYQQEIQNMTAHEIARIRVSNTPALAKHEAIIFADWPEGDEHWRWVASAPIAEIVSWAEQIKAQEE